ncbi:hypothetical protein [Catenulispora subtropica]|uniref:PknH-like extracellular domain-containing protein n=1 Tax=Catenulispora subtropica TaxID=450798 RepID=A0ABP5DFF6_9ACTN
MAKQKDENDPGEGPILSDEEWAEFERSFTKESTKSAAYKEPSARQRELTERWKREQPKDTGWRTDGPTQDRRPYPVGGRPVATVPARRRRPWVRNLVWVLVAMLVTSAVIGGPKLFSSSKDSDSPPPAGGGARPSDLPSVRFTSGSLDPSRAAIVDKPWPAIDAAAALPASIAVGGAGYRRLTTKVSLTCTESMTQALGDLVFSGAGCQQLAAGLYTSPDRGMQFTVSVLSMKRAEDAGTVAAALKIGGLDYQLVELDPPAGSGVPPVPDGAPGYTSSVMTVRSVVVVGAQYSDGGDHDKAAVSGPADALLKAVSDKVAAYEQAQIG